MVSSTPAAATAICSGLTETPIPRSQAPLEILPSIINPPGWERASRESYFIERLPSCAKYIDDSVIIEKINMKEPPLLEENGTRFKSVNPSRTQDMFTHIVDKARTKGMIVNTKKTGLICVSDPRAHLIDEEENVIESAPRIKVLGFFIDSDAGVWSQVNVVCARLRSRSWALARLRKCGLNTEELLRVYRFCIRPSAEYAGVVLHPMLTEEQTECIEAQQVNALRNIYGYGISAAKMRKRANLPTLAQRRLNACRKFAQGLASSPRFTHWMEKRPTPPHPRRSGAVYGVYKELPAKTLPCFNSPLYYYRRLLNGRAER